MITLEKIIGVQAVKRKIIGGILILLLPVLAWSGLASAQTTRTGNTATVSKNETIDSTLWASGRNVDIAGTINGDVFCGGMNVTISGTVHGDIICAAQTLNISGTVDGSVRAAAQTLNVNGSINRNFSVAGQTVTLEGQSKIGEDASIASQDAILNGSVGRDLSIAAQTVTVSGNVGRNVKGQVENLTIASSAVVGGGINYTSKNEAQIVQGAKVSGTVARSEPAQKAKAPQHNNGFKFFAGLSMLVTALLLVLLFPRVFHRVTNRGIESFGKSLLVGFVSSIIVPILIVIGMISIVALPLALLALVAWILIVGLSGAFAAYYTGRLVWRTQKHALLIMLTGAVVLLLIRIIPVVGFIITLLAVWLGIGMILLQLKHHTPKPNYDMKRSK